MRLGYIFLMSCSSAVQMNYDVSHVIFNFLTFYFFIYLFIYLFCLFRAAPVAYGGSQARGLIRAVAASLRQSHINARSEPSLQPAQQLTAMLHP